ncbi:hypothetical protein BDF22DRAFT_743301 [Syncephalis plumigaleata]|nr:hypothetical protein BDF22DRAFT_743301 [Syncephalis plumigaleata]
MSTTNSSQSPPDLTAFNSKPVTLFMDPCAKQSKESLRCIEENPGDKGKCNAYFEAYRDCKKIWLDAHREERKRQNGVA